MFANILSHFGITSTGIIVLRVLWQIPSIFCSILIPMGVIAVRAELGFVCAIMLFSIAAFAFHLASICHKFQWAFLLFHQTKKMRSFYGPKFSIHMADSIRDVDIAKLHDLCLEEYRSIVKAIETARKAKEKLYRPKPRVFILDSIHTVTEIFGSCGGCAIEDQSFIILAGEYVNKNLLSYDYCPFRCVLRHEITHIIASRYGSNYPSFKGEGFAGCFESPNQIALVTTVCEVRRPSSPPKLLELIADTYLLSHKGPEVYGAAESFTAFMIQRFGWDCYWEFYCGSNDRNYLENFKKSFGCDIETVEAEWLKNTTIV